MEMEMAVYGVQIWIGGRLYKYIKKKLQYYKIDSNNY